MSRRNRKRILVPQARDALDQFKASIMEKKGYNVNKENPNDVKYEVAEEQNIPLKKGYNGTLTSKQAGQVGGQIGGSMVKEMIRLAQQNMKNKQ